ncbi:MAG TPA: S41 family peptidase [Chitinophagaceae bacterium]
MHPGKFTLITALLFLCMVTLYGHPLPEDTSKSPCQLRAMHLLDEALDLMQKHYYKKRGVDWDSLVAGAKARLCASGGCDEAYQTINWCFDQLQESHSFIMQPQRAAVYNYDTASLKEKPSLKDLVGEIEGRLLDDGIAYITVPWVGTTDSLICTAIADSLQGLIARLDGKGARKWIVDLRKNSGGNCWPMLAGIGPLLGDGTCGYFVSNSERVPISYSDGAAMHGKYIRCRCTKVYKRKTDSARIAVLVGPRTCSSGEIVALAFKGKDQVSFYGQPTAGLTTANSTYMLSDKSMLVLTVCLEADRTGRVCEGKLVPDEIVNTDSGSRQSDKAIARARMWLDL